MFQAQPVFSYGVQHITRMMNPRFKADSIEVVLGDVPAAATRLANLARPPEIPGPPEGSTLPREVLWRVAPFVLPRRGEP